MAKAHTALYYFWNILFFLFFFLKSIFISFLFHFVLSENNLKTTSTRLPEKCWTLILCSRNTRLALNCQRIQCWYYTKYNTETNTMVARGRKTFTCATKTPELGIFWSGKQMSCKTCPEIIMIVFFLFLVCFSLCIFVCWKFRHIQYTQIVQVNRSIQNTLPPTS